MRYVILLDFVICITSFKRIKIDLTFLLNINGNLTRLLEKSLSDRYRPGRYVKPIAVQYRLQQNVS